MVNYKGWKLEPANDLLTMNWDSSFTQQFGSWASTRFGGSSANDTVALTVTATFPIKASAAGQTITFGSNGVSPTVDVKFQSSSWLSKWFGNGTARDKAGDQMKAKIQSLLENVMTVPVPQVNAFAVSHLLFPTENVLTYSAAFVPGDLAVFGSIAPSETAFKLSPLCLTVGAGQQVTFESSVASESTIWDASPPFGTISPDGTYAAPAVVSEAKRVMITATQASDVATAIVMVVPDGLTITPAFCQLSTPDDYVQFQATSLGQAAEATWSLSSGDGTPGAISQQGRYTPPAPFPDTIQTVTVTATFGSASSSALVCLAGFQVSLDLLPLYVILGENDQQAFVVEKVKPAWSIVPAIGSIDQEGNYLAPATIHTPQTVLVIATYSDVLGQACGVALVSLQPGS
jgi:hypothetical protein